MKNEVYAATDTQPACSMRDVLITQADELKERIEANTKRLNDIKFDQQELEKIRIRSENYLKKQEQTLLEIETYLKNNP